MSSAGHSFLENLSPNSDSPYQLEAPSESKSGFCPMGKSRFFSNWLPIVNEVRTALAKDPLPIEVMKELLAEAA